MPFRRQYAPGAAVFITQVIAYRIPIFRDDELVDLLRAVLHEAQARYPFRMLAYVFLPDHFHLLIRPRPDITHSQIMHSVKPNFTKLYKQRISFTGVGMRFWQARYYDHVIRDEEDFAHHLDYIHYNPVRHGYVSRPELWRHSSFGHWQQRGYYPERWGWSLPDSLHDFSVKDVEISSGCTLSACSP